MLRQLHIRDFAIIDEVELELTGGLTVLTGETGAGKSILVDALQLTVGARAGAEVVRHEATRAEVTATFEISATPLLRAWLEEQSIDVEDELVVRRVVTRDGKSRAYINGQQVTVQQLRQLGESLAEIHGQHEFQSLMRPKAQRELLDDYAGNTLLLTKVAEHHKNRLNVESALEQLAAATRDRESRLELLRHQLDELDALAFDPLELPALIDERQRLANSGRLAEAARGAVHLLYEAEGSNAHATVARALALVKQAAQWDSSLVNSSSALEESVIRLAEVAGDLSRYLDNLEADPKRQDYLEQRLATIESLARKHRIDASLLKAKSAELRAELEQLETLEQNSLELQRELKRCITAWRAAAVELSTARAQAAAALATEIGANMQTLGMAGGQFVISLTPVSGLETTSAHGAEEVEFLVSANSGQPPRPLAKVASGGELSRLSLAVQVVLARANGRELESAGGCMVFDEVDAGVGGAVAEIVGRELATLGERTQVLCVTHLPQVAALGSQHLRVSKSSSAGKTHTKIELLTAEQRVEEIARMLGGITITDTARGHAAEMLTAGQRKLSPAPHGAGNRPSGNGRKSRARGR